MKKKYLIILLLAMFLMPFKVSATGGFGVSNANITMYPGETKTITISTYDSVGKLNISSSNRNVASPSVGSIFIDMVGVSKTFTITGKSIGNATISVIGSENYASYSDEVLLKGTTRNITVNVVAKPTPQPNPSNPTQTPKPQTPSTNNQNNNLSKNNNLKTLEIEGHKLEKIDNNNYTLNVFNDVTSIKINASPEDAKAKITGTGVHQLKVGENKIEVIVTSESGAQNKFNIKVTRKDGYYIEDLDTILKNQKLEDVDINIKEDVKITTEQINKIKNSKKTIRLNYFDKNKKLMYSWEINGNEITESKEFITTITFTTENLKEIYKTSNYADGLYINFKHNGDLPSGTKVKIYVGNKFANKDILKLYHYNNNKLDLIKDNLEVIDEYVEFDIAHCSDYFITMSNIQKSTVIPQKEETPEIDKFMIVAIAELIIMLSLIILYFFKIKPAQKKLSKIEKKDSINSIEEKINENNYINNIPNINNNTINNVPTMNNNVINNTPNINNTVGDAQNITNQNNVQNINNSTNNNVPTMNNNVINNTPNINNTVGNAQNITNQNNVQSINNSTNNVPTMNNKINNILNFNNINQNNNQ